MFRLFAGATLVFVMLMVWMGGLRLSPWFRSGEGRELTRRALLPLLDLPVELVLPSHGEPVLGQGRDALARALEPGA